MGTAKTTIELNGKRYDARTGKIIQDSAEIAAPKPIQKPSNGAVLDGFTRRTEVKPIPKQSKTEAKNAFRKLQKAQTLMRPAVKKPASIKNDIQATKRTPRVEPSQVARHARADAAEKSPMVSRFSGTPDQAVTKKEAHLPVAPFTQAKARIAAAESANSNQLHNFEQKIQNATSHLQQLEKGTIKKVGLLHRAGFRNKIANLSAMSFAVLLLGGFFAYQNVSAIDMRVASTRSGVSAHMPGYKPSGYGVAGRVQSSPGKVSVSFKSRSDTDKGFKITQQTSNWTSTALLSNNVAKNNQPYQTYQNDGKTVYIYDNSNATWVDKGTLYQVEGNANLTSEQLLRIANSF